MPFSFRITSKDKHSRARTGIIKTLHGEIETPEFVPVATNGAVKALTPMQMLEVNAQILMVNTYHCFLRPGADLIAKFGSLHNFMSWKKPLMTDSGGFQIFSLNNANLVKITDESVTFTSNYGKHVFTPELSMQIQQKLGADINFAFDECTPFDAKEWYVKHSLMRTHFWAERCIAVHKNKNQALYGIVQGGQFKHLREESADFISSLPFAGFGVGSIFGQPKVTSYDALKWSVEKLPENKPVHFLGIGAVDDIFAGVELGVDTFDCVLPTRLGRVGYIFSSECKKESKWRYRITNSRFKSDKSPLDRNCDCYICKTFSRAYVHHLFKSNELLSYTLASYHNLAFFSNLMSSIRESIKNDDFQKLKKKWLR